MYIFFCVIDFCQLLKHALLCIYIYIKLLQYCYCLFLMLLCVMLVCFALDFCIFIIYVMLFALSGLLTQFIYSSHYFASYTVLFNQMVFVILC